MIHILEADLRVNAGKDPMTALKMKQDKGSPCFTPCLQEIGVLCSPQL